MKKLWRDIIVLAFEELYTNSKEKFFPLKQIYFEVEKIIIKIGYNDRLDKNWQDTVRRDLQNHDKNSRAYRVGAPDLFTNPEIGYWGLKDEYIDDIINTNLVFITEYDGKYYKRNQVLSKMLKEMYEYKCQISGDILSGNNKLYAEVHHIIPLHKGGADTTENMIVVTPNIHAMLDNMMIKIDNVNRKSEHKIDDLSIKWHNDTFNNLVV